MEKEDLKRILATNLRVERARKDYTQEFVAEKAGISNEYLTKIENEKYNPSMLVAVNLAKALGVTLDTLIPPEEYK